MATTVSQLSCLSSSINRRFKLSIFNRNNNNKNSLTLGTSFANPPKATKKIHVEATATNKYKGITESVEGWDLGFVFTGAKKASSSKGAKLPDYFFGLPYGVLVLNGGSLSFLLSGDWSTLTYGSIVGCLIYYLSRFSQLARREGKSCLPYTLGQAVLSALLFWRNLQNYLLTKALLPANLAPASLSLAISAAMLCFYLYVIISGGNPPPDDKPAVLEILERDNEGNTSKINEYTF